MQQVPAQLTAIHTIRIHGRLDNTLPFANQIDLVMYLGNCANFLKQGATLADKNSMSTVSLDNEDGFIFKLINLNNYLNLSFRKNEDYYSGSVWHL